MENEPGIGLAAPRSPAHQASTTELEDQRSAQPARSLWGWAAGSEITQRETCASELEPLEEDEGAVREINQQFGRWLAALRRLPRHERVHALRAARDWRRQALKSLKEKRATDRHARFLLWRRQKLTLG